jgi:hypothetical protein
MTDQPSKPADHPPDVAREGDAGDEGGSSSERAGAAGAAGAADRGLSDFVRRAVSAGVGAASRSKDDIMRAAASEMRTWLERLDVNKEVLKVLSKMVIEVKTEIRFRPTEDGRLAPEATNEVKVKPIP